jgi:nitrate/nitrite transporter NarK
MSRSRLQVFSPHTPTQTSSRSPSSVPMRIIAVCITSIVVSSHYTNYSPLISTIRAELHISSGQAGLFSTLLFLGLSIAYIPGGMLADRIGARPVLIGSSALLTIGAILLPLYPNLGWILACRTLVGLGSGGAFVVGAGVAAGLGEYAPLGLGLYGGATQVGSGLALLITPHLLPLFGWRGSFLFWGILSASSLLVWLFIYDKPASQTEARSDLRAGLRSPTVWTLGLSHLGTFGLGNAVVAWITIYLVTQYNLPLALAAMFGSIGIIAGMFFRPLGGVLIARRVIGAIPLLRMGTIMGCIGLGLLTLPIRQPLLAIVGIAMIAIGSTIPYTSVFNPVANLRTVSKGVGQGLVGIISSPTVIIGPPLIGFLLDRTHSFTFAFGSIMLFSILAITASFLAGPALSREIRE